MLVKMEAYRGDNHWYARGIGEDIFTQADSADELFRNIAEAVHLHFDGGDSPSEINVVIISELRLSGIPVDGRKPGGTKRQARPYKG